MNTIKEETIYSFCSNSKFWITNNS